MAHPLLPTHRSRALATLGLAGALVLPAAPALALTTVTGQVADEAATVCTEALAATGVCQLVDETVAPPVEAATEAATEALAPVVDATAPLVDAVTEAVPPVVIPPGEVLPPSGDDPAPTTPDPVPGSPSSTGAATTTEPEPTKVQAAGKGPEEVSEPQAPPAADGRIAGGPTIQPLDSASLGSNMAGVRSQNGVTLQDYDAPLVSIPMDAPQIAGAPITTASPVAAMAAEAISFAGSAVLPHTTGAAAWVTASGLGLLAGTGVVWRRRLDTLGVDTLDS